jgi:hypothetical protein
MRSADGRFVSLQVVQGGLGDGQTALFLSAAFA